MEWNLKILGSSSALPTDTRMLSSQLLTTASHHFLFDCGEGTQFQLRRFGAPISKIDAVFISHLHGDHVFGLFGLLSTYGMYKREKPLKIYGQKGIRELVETVLSIVKTRINFPMEIMELNPNSFQEIFEDEELQVFSLPLKHSVDTTGFYVLEKFGKLNIKKEFVKNHEIAYSWFPRIKNGEDYIDEQGNVFKNSEITNIPSKPKSYAYVSDTAFLPQIANYFQEVDLLYHEATFANEHQEEAKIKLHTTAQEAAKVALLAKAKKMVIGHFSTRYKSCEKQLSEAQEVFPNTFCAFDGMDINF